MKCIGIYNNTGNMQRRGFIKSTLYTSTGILLLPSILKAGATMPGVGLGELEPYFLNPPASARPWCFWMWMNGNITKQGITLDLEAMQRMGIGGVINFNSAVGIPRGTVDYASDEWMEMVEHAAKEAARLGIVYTIHNSPGYSGCGGPWITPELSMQQLVWTETLAESNGSINIQLNQPYAKLNYYRDALVIAYPSLPAEHVLMKDAVSSILVNGKPIDKTTITDGNLDHKLRLEAEGKEATILLEFTEPFEARAITIYRKPEIPHDLFDGPRDHPPVFKLEYSYDGNAFTFIGNVRCPELREMDTPATLSFTIVTAKYYRLTATTSSWLCNIELHNGPRLAGWSGKTNHTHGDSTGTITTVEQENSIDPLTVTDITGHMNEDGRLVWNAPRGRWTILRIGHTTTGEIPAAHPDSAGGLETDMFNKAALDAHFEHFLDKLINRIKPYTSFKGVTIDSWEAGKQNWTRGFPALFQQQNGYSIAQWMPAMTGRIVKSTTDTENFLWDVRRTQANLLSENFYGHYKDNLHKRGLELYAEPYGDGNLDGLQIGKHLDVTMSEFWTRNIYGSDLYSKQAVSAAHIYGQPIVMAEAFTAMPATSKWTDYPYSLKAEGDYFFSLGVNRLCFHVFVHQPYTTGLPGMTMGPFGMHIDRNNTWTEQAYGWASYLQRTQYLLQQGLTIADVLYFKGDNPESGVPDVYRFLSQGYKGDVFGTDALQKKASITNGKIVLAGGMEYRVCVLASLEQILPATMSRMKDLVKEGMVLIVSNKPVKAYGNHKDSEVVAIVNELYGDLDGKQNTERTYGKGRIIWSDHIDTVLLSLHIQPDFTYTAANTDATIHYLHKKIGDDELYFISNHKRRDEPIVCSLRISGKQPEIWNSETGEIYEAVLFETEDGRTNISLVLPPAGSLFVVFRKLVTHQPLTAIIQDSKTVATVKAYAITDAALYKEVYNHFSISAWVKPDTFAHTGRSMLCHAPEGETVYGSGHAAMAISAGVNAITVFERTKGAANAVLTYTHPIEGWTYLVVNYTDGKPSLFVNGQLALTANATGKVVHPGLGTAAALEQFASYFEGNYTTPQLFKKVLSNEQVAQLFTKGLPEPLLPTGLQVIQQNNQRKVLAWANGNYQLQSGNTTQNLDTITGCKAIDTSHEWTVQFPASSGVGSAITLPVLESLHKHSDDKVRYFSGTCVYHKTIVIPASDLQQGKRIWLHLGRVEVIASLQVNGQPIGLLWKEPFMADITAALKAGDNTLEIAVTNLWPNRLIGDESLPAENTYSEQHFIDRLPDWYTHNQPKPGERKSFAVWKTYTKGDPLLESGLLGPVTLLTAIEKIV